MVRSIRTISFFLIVASNHCRRYGFIRRVEVDIKEFKYLDNFLRTLDSSSCLLCSNAFDDFFSNDEGRIIGDTILFFFMVPLLFPNLFVGSFYLTNFLDGHDI